MQLKTVVAKSLVLQTTIDNIQRCGFLGNEQHRLSLRQTMRNHVGNCLALPGAWRPNEYKILSGIRGSNRRKL